MTDFRPIFERLGLQQYIQIFSNEGFETWETILEITESDLDALKVKLGHRRVLQREIASVRGGAEPWVSVNSPSRSQASLDSGSVAPEDIDDAEGTDQTVSAPRKKRRYRRHPKPDENAPTRPPSAYVVFSNKIREDLKDQSLSFTEIAKRVGENWQQLSASDKEPYETQASVAKEHFHQEMAAYKTTEMYRDYQRYLADFKEKYGNATDQARHNHDLSRSTSRTTLGSARGASPPARARFDPPYHSNRDAAPLSMPPYPREPQSLVTTSDSKSISVPTASPSHAHFPGKEGESFWSKSRNVPTEPYSSRSPLTGNDQQQASQPPTYAYRSTPVNLGPMSSHETQFIQPRRRPIGPTDAIPSFRQQESSRSSLTSSKSSTSTAATSHSAFRSTEDDMPQYVKLPPISTVTGLSRERHDFAHPSSLQGGHLSQGGGPPNFTARRPHVTNFAAESKGQYSDHEQASPIRDGQRTMISQMSRPETLPGHQPSALSDSSRSIAPPDRLSILANIADRSQARQKDAPD